MIGGNGVTTTIGLALVLATGSLAQESQPVLQDRFLAPALGPEWTVDVSKGNTVAVKDGTVEITAAENTYAHIERALGADRVRASCQIKPGSGVSWCTSLFVYWKPGDWCQIGIIPRKGGRHYVCITAAGQRTEHDLSLCRFDEWHHVAIELGEDCIRFLSSPDGRSWKTEVFVPRPASMAGPAALVILGKGFGLDPGQPDQDGDYGDRGTVATSGVRDLVVQPTDPSRLHITAEERRAKELTDRDPVGTAIIERGADPDFDTVAAVYPPLAKPREVVGVKDDRYEVGVEYDGTIQLADDTDLWEQTGAVAFFEIGSPPVRFGTGGCRKRLADGYLPIVVSAFEHDGLRYEETVLGYSERLSPDADMWGYVRLQIMNPSAQKRTVDVTLRFQSKPEAPAPLQQQVAVPAGGTAEACFKIPSPMKGRSPAPVDRPEFAARLAEVTASWKELLNAGMQVTVPEPRVNDAYRAWLAYNFLDVDKQGDQYRPHDGAGFYEETFGYSAVLYCHALDLWGYHEDSRRYLESLLTLQKDDGLFYARYGVPDHGGMLMALSEHYRLTGDKEWLLRTAPRMVKMCDWVVAKRKESMKEESGKRPVTWGLIRYTPYADYQAQTFNLYGDTYCCTGMEHAATVLREAGLTAEADRIAAEAAAYRKDILASMDAAVIERDGMKLLPIEPDTQRLLKSTNYRGGSYYGLVASMLLENKFLPADDVRAGWLVGALERRGGLILGMCEFDEGVDHAYTYGYWLNCLRRDEIPRVLLGFYGTLAYGMGRDTYCGVEVTQLTTGEPTPTTPHLYSGTQQLRLLRMMLLHEQGRDLVIGKAIPRGWLAAGKRIDVRNAPTHFGPVSFTIEAAADGQRIDCSLRPPTDRPPQSIRLHMRHPSKKPIRQVEIDGKPWSEFRDDTLTLRPAREPMTIRVLY